MRFLNKSPFFCYFIVFLLIWDGCNGGFVRRHPRSAEVEELTIDRDFTLKRVKPPVGKAKVPSKSANAEFLNSFSAEVDATDSESPAAVVTLGNEEKQEVSTGKETNVLPEVRSLETTTSADSELTLKPVEVSAEQIIQPGVSVATETVILPLENEESTIIAPEEDKESSSTTAVQNPVPNESESPNSSSEAFVVTSVTPTSSESTVETVTVQAGPSEVPNPSLEATEASTAESSVSESSPEPTMVASASAVNELLSTNVPEAIESSSASVEAFETSSTSLNSTSSTSTGSNSVPDELVASSSTTVEETVPSTQNEVTPSASKEVSAPGVAPEPSEQTAAVSEITESPEALSGTSEAPTSSSEASATLAEDVESSSSLEVAAKLVNIASQTIEGSISPSEGTVAPQTIVEIPSRPQEGDIEETTGHIIAPGTSESPDLTSELPNGSTSSPVDNETPSVLVGTSEASTSLPEASKSSISESAPSTLLPSAPKPSTILIPPPKDLKPTSEVIVESATSSPTANVAPKGPQGPAEPSTIDPFYLQPFPTFSLPIITEIPGWTGQMPDDIHVFDPLNELQHVQIPGYRGAVEESWKSVSNIPGAIGNSGKLDPVLAAFPPAHYFIPYETFLDEGNTRN